MNLYSELLELLTPAPAETPVVLFGTLTSLSPLCVTVGGAAVSEGLHRLAGLGFTELDLGRDLAVLVCGDGLLILGKAEGV